VIIYTENRTVSTSEPYRLSLRRCREVIEGLLFWAARGGGREVGVVTSFDSACTL
jgi:hypothetical protein